MAAHGNIISYWITNQKPFLIQILIYKNKMVKRIISEYEKRDQEEIQDCEILDTRYSEQPLDFTKIQSPRL